MEKSLRFNGLVGWTILSFVWLIGSGRIFGQDPTGGTSPQASIKSSSAKVTLSPGAKEVSQLIGVTALLERLTVVRSAEPQSQKNLPRLEELWIRQGITEAVLACSLEVDGVLAEIDAETAQINDIRGYLELRRDRIVGVNTLANIISSGGMGIVSSLLQMKQNTARWGNGVGATSGGASMVLSLVGIRQQRGGQRTLGEAPNMLAQVLNRKPEFHSSYPEEVWMYLNSVPPSTSDGETRRQRLIRDWTELGRILKSDSPKEQQRIELLTSSISSRKELTIDLLADRAAMLQDVRSRVAIMKRDLSKLMLAVRDNL